MRLFVAIGFNNETRAKIKKIQDNLKWSSLDGNFTDERNFHITLAFLGETHPDKISLITESIQDAAASTVPFTLSLKGTGFFKGRGNGDTWWIGICRSSRMEALRNALAGNLEKAGFKLEKQVFVPHLTIGREIRMPACYDTAGFSGSTGTTEVKVGSISLMKSERLDGRLVYTVIREVRLGTEL